MIDHIEIQSIFRYPVKALAPQRLQETVLEPHCRIAGDRRFAIAHGKSEVDRNDPQWVRRHNFAVVATTEELTALTVSYDTAGKAISISGGGLSLEADLSAEAGRIALTGFLDTYLPDSVARPVTVVEAAGSPFTDNESPFISIINLATVRALETLAGEPVQPQRFRGNFIIDTGEAWSERALLGRRLQAGTRAILQVEEHIERCAVINVNPETAIRSGNLPAAILRNHGHMDCGIFVRVLKGGTIREGDPLKPV